MNKFAARQISSVIACGYFPFASGTFASFVCTAVWMSWGVFGLEISLPVLAATIILLSFLGLLSVRVCIRDFEAKLSRRGYYKVDPSFIVIDEWVGMLISLIGISSKDYFAILLSFALFRLFDIIKPGPVRWAEKLPGEWGIMLDDIIAGVFALAARELILAVF